MRSDMLAGMPGAFGSAAALSAVLFVVPTPASFIRIPAAAAVVSVGAAAVEPACSCGALCGGGAVLEA